MSRLLEPLTFRCGARARNRIALSPLTNQQSHDDGRCSDEERRWLARRAAGGFGLIFTCSAHVDAQARGFEGQLGVWGEHCVPGLARLAEDLDGHGVFGLVQLYHGGARCPSALNGGRQGVSASAFTLDSPGFEVPRAATADELPGIVGLFRDAAVRVDRAGLAGVEVHGAHGNLFTQFLSRTMNPRTDGWGGDLEGRARLLRETVRSIREATRPDFLIAVRLSPEDGGFARGLDIDESVQVAAWLADDGVDLVDLSLWDATRNTSKYPDRHPIPMFREALPASVRLSAAGRVWTAGDGERLLDRGADLVKVGKAGVLDPDWPRNVVRDGLQPVRGPMSPAALREREVYPPFVAYLRNFGMVDDG